VARVVRRLKHVVRAQSPDLTPVVARATLGVHGTTLDALYNRVDASLTRSLSR